MSLTVFVVSMCWTETLAASAVCLSLTAWNVSGECRQATHRIETFDLRRRCQLDSQALDNDVVQHYNTSTTKRHVLCWSRHLINLRSVTLS